MTEADIQRLDIGECIINADGRIFSHKGDDWSDPGVFEGYSDELVRRHIEQLKEWGILKPPPDISYETQPCEPKEAKAPTKRVRKGMG